jgi:cytochrome P450
MAAGSAFVGNELCYRNEWIDASIGYTVDVMGAGRSLKAWPARFRGIAAKFDPLVRRSQEHRDAIKKFLGPVITERKANAGKPGWEKPDDMLQWMIEKSGDFGIHDDEYMATVQLGVGLVSIHSTTITCTQALYDLASKPEYKQPLRDEIMQALKDSNGIFTKEALYNCKLLDSFVKESQRLNPITMVIGKRILRQPVTLSSGTHLPKGTRVAVPTEAVSNDPENFPEPEKFDGYRFVKLRSAKEGSTSQYHQFVTANKTSLNFGYGKHACPGRFFAAAEIKMILAHFLINYDFELENGPARPTNIIHGDSVRNFPPCIYHSQKLIITFVVHTRYASQHAVQESCLCLKTRGVRGHCGGTARKLYNYGDHLDSKTYSRFFNKEDRHSVSLNM